MNRLPRFAWAWTALLLASTAALWAGSSGPTVSDAQMLQDQTARDYLSKAAAEVKEREDKARAVAEAKRKEEEQQRRAAVEAKAREERLQLYRTDPEGFWAKYVREKFILSEGRLHKPQLLTVHVSQIPKEGQLLGWPIVGSIESTGRPVFVEGVCTSNVVEGQRICLPAKVSGTHRHVDLAGATRKIPKYTVVPFVSQKEFAALSAQGTNALVQVEALLSENP